MIKIYLSTFEETTWHLRVNRSQNNTALKHSICLARFLYIALTHCKCKKMYFYLPLRENRNTFFNKTSNLWENNFLTLIFLKTLTHFYFAFSFRFQGLFHIILFSPNFLNRYKLARMIDTGVRNLVIIINFWHWPLYVLQLQQGQTVEQWNNYKREWVMQVRLSKGF